MSTKTAKEKQQSAIYARINYRKRRIETFKHHLQLGTFPPRIKSMKPFPKMKTAEGQQIVHAACQQAQRVLLDQMLIEEEQQLSRDQDLLKQHHQTTKKPSMAQVLKELVELQRKYNEATRANSANKICDARTTDGDTKTSEGVHPNVLKDNIDVSNVLSA